MRSYLEKLQTDYESALQRNSALPRGKSAAESEEVLAAVSVARTNYRAAAVDTVYTLTLLHARKRFEVLDGVLSALQAHKTFFHQGHDFFKDTDPFLKSLSADVRLL